MPFIAAQPLPLVKSLFGLIHPQRHGAVKRQDVGILRPRGICGVDGRSPQCANQPERGAKPLVSANALNPFNLLPAQGSQVQSGLGSVPPCPPLRGVPRQARQGPVLPGRAAKRRTTLSSFQAADHTGTARFQPRPISQGCASMQGLPWPDCTLSHHAPLLSCALPGVRLDQLVLRNVERFR